LAVKLNQNLVEVLSARPESAERENLIAEISKRNVEICVSFYGA